MKILCLHGHGTSSAIFEIQLAGIREALGDGYEYVYLDGPVESSRVQGMFACLDCVKSPPTLMRR